MVNFLSAILAVTVNNLKHKFVPHIQCGVDILKDYKIMNILLKIQIQFWIFKLIFKPQLGNTPMRNETKRKESKKLFFAYKQNSVPLFSKLFINWLTSRHYQPLNRWSFIPKIFIVQVRFHQHHQLNKIPAYVLTYNERLDKSVVVGACKKIVTSVLLHIFVHEEHIQEKNSLLWCVVVFQRNITCIDTAKCMYKYM